MKLIVGISGSIGVIYGIRLLEVLRELDVKTPTLEIIWHMLTNSEGYRTQNHELTRRKHKKIKVKSQLS